jgi:hypothetical protein
MDDEGTSTSPAESGRSSDSVTSPASTPDAGSERASPPRRLGVPIIVGIALVLVAVAAMAASALVRDIGPPLPETFKATDAIPYSVRYPDGWSPQDAGFGVLIAPLKDLATMAPEQLATILEEVPEDVVAMELFGVAPAQQYAGLTEQPGLKLGDDEQVEVGGYPARRVVLSGKLFGPAQDEEGQLTLWLVDVGGDKMVLVGFVSADAAEDASLFDAMIETVEFDQAKLEAAVTAVDGQLPPGAPTPPPPTPAG